MDKLSPLLIILTLGSCYGGGEKKHVNEEAIEFQNLSTEQILNRDYDSALYFIDKALSVDSNYYLGQYQRLTILWNPNRNEEALQTAKKISELRNYNNLSIEGMAYEKLGNLAKANCLYKTTVDSWPKAELDSNFHSRLEYSQIGTVVYGKEFGLQEIAKIDTMKLNESEIYVVNTIWRTIEKYQGSSYSELMENINVLPN